MAVPWLAWFALAACMGHAQDSASVRIEALENAWNQAVRVRDVGAIGPILGSELIFIDSSGKVMDKDGYLASVRSSQLEATQIVNESLKVQVFGRSAIAIGVYREKGLRRGKPYLHRERFVDMWVNRQSAWICVASQSTAITR